MPRILIVDDNEPIRYTLKRMLSQHDGWVICGEATNGKEAVQLANELKPDAVLLDFKMPIMNGLQAAKEIIKNDPSIPIAMYTLDQSARFESEARRIGVRKVISKTDMFQTLTSSLDDMVDSKTNGPKNSN